MVRFTWSNGPVGTNIAVPYDSGHTSGGETLGLREEKKRETRAAIVAIALELFRTQGFERTRIQDISER